MSQHLEQLGDKWFPLLADPSMIPGVVATTISQGGTRPVWGVERGDTQTMLMAWPEQSLLRSGVVVSGPRDGQLEPVTVVPLMEGFPNTMTVVETYPWKGGLQGEVLVQPQDEVEPIWFFDPLFFRDAETDLTPGVAQTFYLSGMCYGIRRALLDEMTVTSGPNYEAHAAHWLEAHPDRTRLDVPPLKISLRGLRVLGPLERCCEFQGRVRIYDVDSFLFGPEGAQEKVYRFGATFGTAETPIHVLLYAPERICVKGYVPEEGHEVDVVFWMQGRVVDAGDDAPEMVDDPELDGYVPPAGATPEDTPSGEGEAR